MGLPGCAVLPEEEQGGGRGDSPEPVYKDALCGPCWIRRMSRHERGGDVSGGEMDGATQRSAVWRTLHRQRSSSGTGDLWGKLTEMRRFNVLERAAERGGQQTPC